MAYRPAVTLELQNPYILFLITMFGAAILGSAIGHAARPHLPPDQ